MDYLAQHYRFPPNWVKIDQIGKLPQRKDFFRFREAVCYGRCAGLSDNSLKNAAFDSMQASEFCGNSIHLPFDLTEVVDNLRNEEYVTSPKSDPLLERIYYFFRPILSIDLRKQLQKLRLNGWQHLRFPQWPVDHNVDTLFEQLVIKSLQSRQDLEVPFIWFWPDGASSCAIVTHDVESASGRDFCSSLMDIDDSFGMAASFQIVPDGRYEVSADFLSSIRDRGFEINIQDLNHDGRLFSSHSQFLSRVQKINSYGEEYGAKGFRAAVLYRNQQWFDALNFSYDMSVPNVGHLDPQRGGCCTVMPFFIGQLVELPVTMTQDYSLFHILSDYSIDLWKRQIDIIMKRHGLMSCIIHPDYLRSERARTTYHELLGHFAMLREEKNVWIPLPGEVNRWWRQRAKMFLVKKDGQWRIEGEGSERARVALASAKNGVIEFSLTPEVLIDTNLQSGRG